MTKKKSFIQKNGLEIFEGRLYMSHVGDLVKIKSFDEEKDEVQCYNVSESCNSWHMLSRALKENKFRSAVR
jgi:hypothetical protein